MIVAQETPFEAEMESAMILSQQNSNTNPILQTQTQVIINTEAKKDIEEKLDALTQIS